jgi:hypothetical protein
MRTKEENNAYMKMWNAKNPDKVIKSKKKRYLKHKDKILAKNKEWRENNKEYKAKKDREYFLLNKEKRLEYIKNWRLKNKKTLNKKWAANMRKRRKKEPLFRLKGNLSSRIKACLKANKFIKTQNTEKILGADMIIVKLHIEKQFKKGMDWSNHGLVGKVWHIDHIIPLASAKTQEEVYKLCHYTNLQPLWAIENIKKGDRIG